MHLKKAEMHSGGPDTFSFAPVCIVFLQGKTVEAFLPVVLKCVGRWIERRNVTKEQSVLEEASIRDGPTNEPRNAASWVHYRP